MGRTGPGDATEVGETMQIPVVVGLLFMLAGCNSAPQSTVVIPPVTCHAGKDCDEKWSRATGWIAQNSSYKVQTVSDTIIQTMGPLPDSPRAEFIVSKVSIGNDLYSLKLNGGCDNMFGCIPPLQDSALSFANFVNAK